MSAASGYIAREVTLNFLAVLTLLLLVTLGVLFGDTVTDVARGRLPLSLLFAEIALAALRSLTVLAPLAFFLGALLAVGRLYRNSEMYVLHAAGFSSLRVVGAVCWPALPVAVLMLVVGTSGAAWAERTSRILLEEAVRSFAILGLKPGRFQSVAGDRFVVFTESVDAETGRFFDAIIFSRREDRYDIVVADSGYQRVDEASGARALVLENGERIEGAPGSGAFRRLRFAENEIRLPDLASPTDINRIEMRPARVLFSEEGPEVRAEQQWRLVPALSTLLLGLTAVPLARSGPRSGLYGSLIAGLAVYFLYTNLLAIGRHWIETEAMTGAMGLWPFHLVLLIAVVLYDRMYRRTLR